MQRERRVPEAGRAGSSTAGCSGPGVTSVTISPAIPYSSGSAPATHPAGLVKAGEHQPHDQHQIEQQDDRQSFLPRHPPIVRAAAGALLERPVTASKINSPA